MRRQTGRTRAAQLDGYLARIVDQDFAEAGHSVRRPAQLTHWLRAYASATATVAAFETIRDAATGDRAEKPAKGSSEVYRDVLTRLWVPRRAPGVAANAKCHRRTDAGPHTSFG